MAKLSELISKAAILSLGGFLFFYGLAGDQLPTVNAKLTEAEGWLADHTGFPSLVVAGATCSGLYRIAEWHTEGRREKRRGQLITLMKEGVALRNDGAFTIQTPKEAAEWIDRSDGWRKRARALASGGLSLLLALEVVLTGRAATDRDRPPHVDPADEHREPALGSAAHPWRTAEARV